MKTAKQLLNIILAVTFIGCSNSNQQVKENSLTDKVDVRNVSIDENSVTGTKQKGYKILPTDESKSNATLVAFITTLKKIVSTKDTTGLFRSLDNEIVVSHGGGIYGIQEFAKEWNLNMPEQSALWNVLERILKMGGTWENDEEKSFCIPYAQSSKAFSRYDYDFDWYITAVCISPDVIVYKDPKSTATRVATLSYDIVETDPESTEADFIKIHTLDRGIEGYVKTSDLIYAADHHLVIKKINNKWKITAFAPFD